MAPVRCRSTRHYPEHEEYREIKWPFPATTAPPRARIGPYTPRQRLASARCRRQATGPPGWALGAERLRGWGCTAGGPDLKRGERAVEERGAMRTALPWGQATKNSRVT